MLPTGLSLGVKIKIGSHLLPVAYEDGDSIYVVSVRRFGERLEANSGVPRMSY